MRIGKVIFLGCFFPIVCFLALSAAPRERGSKTAHKELIYDFLSPEASQIPARIWYRHAVTLKVKNFNPFLYDLIISGQVVSYNQGVPALFTTALAGSAPDAEEAKEKAEDAQARWRDQAAVGDVKDRYLIARGTYEVALESVYMKVPEAERIVVESIGYSDDLSRTKILELIKEGEGALCNGNRPVLDPLGLRNLLWPVITNVRKCWRGLDGAFQGLPDKEKPAYQAEYDEDSTRWRTFDSTDRAKFEGALNNAVSTWRSLERAEFEISGGPFFADGDELIIKITATRKAGLDARFLTNRACSERPVAWLRTEGGIKLDFSAGFAFGRPVDRVFSMKSKSETDATQVIARNTDNESFCAVLPAAFLHIYPRNGRELAVAGTFGIASNTSGAFDYYLGGSLLLGASQRGVLTVGIGVRKIAVLGGGLKVDDQLPSGITAIPVSNVFRLGYCVGFSFNLGGI